MEAAPHPWPALGVLLMRDGLVTKEELEDILREQQDTRQQRLSGRRLGEILIQRGRVTPTQVARLVAEQYELPFVDFDVGDLEVRAASVLSEDDARRFSAIPINRRPDGSFLLAIADPATVLFSDELRRLLDSVPRFVVVGPDAIERAIDFVHGNPRTHTGDVSEHEAVVVPLTHSDVVPQSSEPAPSHGPLAQTWPPLGALLVRDGFLTDADLDTALARQRLSPSHRLGEILVQNGVVTQSVVARLVAEQYELPFVDLRELDVDVSTARLLPEEVAHRLCAVPVAASEDGRLEVAIADPTNAVYSDELQQALDTPLTFVVAAPDEIEALLDVVHAQGSAGDLGERAAGTGFDVSSYALDEPATEPFEPTAVETEPTWTVVDASGEAAVPMAPEPSLESSEPLPESHAPEEPVTFELAFPPFPEHDFEPQASELADEPVAHHVEEASDPHVFGATFGEPTAATDFEVVGDLVPPEEPAEPGEPRYEITLVPVTEPTETEPTVAEQPSPGSGADAPQDDEEPELAFELPALTGGFENLFTPPFVTPAPSDPMEVTEEAEPAVVDAEVEPAAAHVEPFEPVEPVGHTEQAVVDVAAPVVVALEPDEPTDDLEPDEPAQDLDTAVTAALAAGAATIHFSAQGTDFSVRARVDGLVRDLGTATPEERDVIVRRLEADGTVRTHVVATSRGDKTTLFVVARPGEPTTIDELGLDPRAVEDLRTALRTSPGAVLVCGPTGSGTTTSLYAALTELATPDLVVTTVEWPVERQLDGIDQIEADPFGDVSFASALQRLRFTDSDVVLVGELPDRETAELALQAAYEGRRVLAGLRAPTAAAALQRLATMGVDTALLSSALSCVCAQRLVRTICPDCRETHYAAEAELEALGHAEDGAPRLLAHGRGCPACDGSGFRGRTALFEVVPMTTELRRLVSEGASEKKLQRAVAAAGTRTLRDEGVRLCLEGVTTVAELERVLGLDD